MLELIASNTIVRVLLLMLIFALAFAIFVLAYGWINRRSRVAREMGMLKGTDTSAANTGTLTRAEKEGAWTRLANRLEASGLKLDDTKDNKVRLLLKQAGYRSPTAPRVYSLVRLVLVFVLPGWYLLLSSMADEPPSVLRLYLTCSALGLFGLYAPNLFVRAKADRRRTEIINGFPDCLDLLLVCVEAGLGLEAALDRVGREMVGTHPLVAETLTETTLLMRAGASREESLRRLAESSGVNEIRSFATLLIQSDKLGTSIANTLRVYAKEMRDARRMRAEEKAHRLPVLISIPLVVFMLPTMIGVLALPAIVRVVRDVVPALGA